MWGWIEGRGDGRIEGRGDGSVVGFMGFSGGGVFKRRALKRCVIFLGRLQSGIYTLLKSFQNVLGT